MSETLITLGLKIAIVGVIVLVLDFLPSYLLQFIERKNNWVSETLSLIPNIFFIISVCFVVIGLIIFVIGMVFGLFQS